MPDDTPKAEPQIASIGGRRFLIAHSARLPDDQDGHTEGHSAPDPIQGIIRLRPELRGKDYLDTLVHEWLHALLPFASEDWVGASANELSELLYSQEHFQRAGFG